MADRSKFIYFSETISPSCLNFFRTFSRKMIELTNHKNYKIAENVLCSFSPKNNSYFGTTHTLGFIYNQIIKVSKKRLQKTFDFIMSIHFCCLNWSLC